MSKKNEGLTSRRKEATSKHVKAAPDFEKLHKKWQTKLAKVRDVGPVVQYFLVLDILKC